MKASRRLLLTLVVVMLFVVACGKNENSKNNKESTESLKAETTRNREGQCGAFSFTDTVSYQKDGKMVEAIRRIDNDAKSYDVSIHYDSEGNVSNYRVVQFDADYPKGKEICSMNFSDGYLSEKAYNAGLVLFDNFMPNNLIISQDDWAYKDVPDYRYEGVAGLDMDTTKVEEMKLRKTEQGNRIIYYGSHEIGIFDPKTREEKSMYIYPFIDEVAYNDKNQIVSIYSYVFKASEVTGVSLDNYDEYEPDAYIRYEYDDEGKVIKEEGKAPGRAPQTITYEYN